VSKYRFESWEDDSTNPTRIVNLNANKEIKANYRLASEMVEINKTITTTAQVTVDIKWIEADTEPATPDGYTRAANLDLAFGIMGTLFAFIKD